MQTKTERSKDISFIIRMAKEKGIILKRSSILKIAEANRIQLKRTNVSPEEKEEIMTLFDQGFSIAEISQKLQRDKATIRQIITQANRERSQPQDEENPSLL